MATSNAFVEVCGAARDEWFGSYYFEVHVGMYPRS